MPLKTLKTRSRELRERDDDSASDPYSDEMDGSSSPSMLDTGEFERSDNDDNSDSDGSAMESSIAETRSNKPGSKTAASRASLSAAPPSSLNKRRKRDEQQDEPLEEEAMLEGLRRQLQMLKEGKRIDASAPANAKRVKVSASKPKTHRASRPDDHADEDPSDDDQDPSGEEHDDLDNNEDQSESDSDTDTDSDPGDPNSATNSPPRASNPTTTSTTSTTSTTPNRKRPSKHAPTAIPTTKQVSRKRTVVSTDQPSFSSPSSRRPRDPRFTPGSGPAPSRELLRRNYDFLDEYRRREIAALRARLGDGEARKKNNKKSKKSKTAALTETQRAELQRELARLQGRERARREEERAAEVVRRHRRAEQEAAAAAVAEGGGGGGGGGRAKRPFYLKRSAVRAEVLRERFEAMGPRERERAVARRRRKVAARERRGGGPGESRFRGVGG